MLGLGPMEVLLIFLIIFLLFGARKLPELARALGRAKKEFKKASSEITEEVAQLEKDRSKERETK